MHKLDRLIKEALSEEEQSILDDTQELGWFELGRSQFRGKLGWITWSIMIIQGLLFFVGVWCAYKCYGAIDVLPALKWGLTGSVLIIVAACLKFSLMPQMQADRILRELKRVELMIAHSK